MEIFVYQHPLESVHELTYLEITVPDFNRSFILDIDYSEILKRSWNPHVKALDFLVIAATAYAVDKIVARASASDSWTRHLAVTIPVQEPEEWNAAADALAESLTFLTGDVWNFKFTKATSQFSKRRTNRRVRPKGYPKSPIVSLFSGGLDSFIGALDLLEKYPEHRLLFVSHYDGQVSGPASDQENLRRFLESKFPGRISHLQVRTGVVLKDELPVEENEDAEDDASKQKKYKFETSFRSRSLVFLGLAVYAAAKLGDDIPVIIPENGPIALNLPLNSSRRGSCSTRTVHPQFISTLQAALKIVGINNSIENPYEFKTKGEMVAECKFPDFVKEAFSKSNSCGKAGRKMHWKNRKAHGCGACIPCLFRRASLHVKDWDTETYGNDVLSSDPPDYPRFSCITRLGEA